MHVLKKLISLLLSWSLVVPAAAQVRSVRPVRLSAPSAPAVSRLGAPRFTPVTAPGSSLPRVEAAPRLAPAPAPRPAQALAVHAEEALADFQTSPVENLAAEEASGAGSRLLDFGQAPSRSGSVEAVAELPGATGLSAPGTEEPTRVPAAPAPSAAPEKKPFFIRHCRLARWALLPVVKLLYSVRSAGLENLPAGPALVVPNHVSYADALIVAYAAGRPMRFMLYRPIYETKGLQWLFKALGAIPVSSKDSKEEIERSLARASSALKAGETVVIFPEGALTHTGNMAGFRRGFERIAAASGAPVIPAHIDGLWGSLFSRQTGRSLWIRLKEIPRPVAVRFGPAMERPEANLVREAVQELSAASMEDRLRRSAEPLPRAFLRTAKSKWSQRAFADSLGQDLSYGKALTGVVLLAGLLKPEIGAASHVGVLLPPSAGGALANIAVGTLGKVPVNLNYTASAEAMAHALKKGEVQTIVTSRKFLEALKAKGVSAPEGKLVLLEDLLPKVPGWKKVVTLLALRLIPRALAARVYFNEASRSLDDPATVLFTSGSSALPKGVVLSHLNIRADIEMVREVFPIGAKDAIMGVLPFFHSFGYTVTLWYALVTGIPAIYHTHPLETDAIAKLAAKFNPTILLGTPTFLQRYVQKIPAEAFRALKFVVAGAEKLRGSIADEFEKKFGARPYEGYGATELSPVASVNLPDTKKQKGNREGSVGQALPGSVMKVVDPDTGASVPAGEPGMLLVKGPHAMRGYLDEPAKTAEALKDGWYVTGDIASIDREGFVTLVGRLSRFSKIAGEMISHVAVEENLQAAIGSAEQVFVVSAVPDERRGERLVVLYAGYDGSIEELLAKAKAAGLPGLWTPSKESFHKVDAIPVLGTGKLDLKAVKELAAKLEAGL